MRRSLIQTRTPNGHLYRVTYTRCRIDTINSPDDGHMAARNTYRIEINIYEKELRALWLVNAPPGLILKNSTLCPQNARILFVLSSVQRLFPNPALINRFVYETECVYCAVRTEFFMYNSC